MIIRNCVSKGAMLRALAASLTTAALWNVVSQEQHRERFLKPSAEARILKIIHGWPDDAGAQDRLIHSLSNQNFGGVVCNVSFTDYLESDNKWQAFRRAVTEAKKAGFALWLYDEKGYPSGAAGGLVLRTNSEWEARGLLVAETETRGGAVTLQIPPGKLRVAAAFPIREGTVDAGKRRDLVEMISGQALSWDAPVGPWKILAITEDRLFEGTHASMSLAEHLPYPNLLDPKPTARFLELTHQRYARHLGNDLGRSFVATFTDEPSLMSLFLKRMPYRVLPWSPHLAVDFKKRRGYELESWLPLLVLEAGPQSGKARYDYWLTVGEMVSANFFGQIQEWCAKHDIPSGGHLLMEEDLASHVGLYGDFFRCLRRLDAPSIDCLTSLPGQVPWFIARLAASAAELEGKRIVMCETSDHSQRYRPPGDQRPVENVTPQQIRGTCNRLIRSGINCITSYYTFAGLNDAELRELNLWVGRCCAAVTGGHQVADIAVVYPIESIWPKFTPSRQHSADCASALQIGHLFRSTSEALYAADRDFTYVDSQVLAEAKAEKDELVYGHLRWRVVILPGVDTLPLKAWETVSEFARNGGLVIALGARPANSEAEFPSGRVREIGNGIFGDAGGPVQVKANPSGGGGVFLSPGSTALLSFLLDRVLARHVKAAAEADSGVPSGNLKTTHRRIDGREVFFVINDSPDPWSGNIDFCAAGDGELWDVGNGSIRPLSVSKGISQRLDPYGAVIFSFANASKPNRSPLDDKITPKWTFRNSGPTQPLLAQGEFVQAELKSSGKDWVATGTLTKAQVDTFLFVRLPYAQGVDLAAAHAIVIDTAVPPGQDTPAQILVILHEKGGADYLASTGRLLSAPGEQQSWLSLDRFQLAGWSKDADGKLDPSEITEIRVGWGGYLGEKDEKIQFTLRVPSIARVE